MPIVPQVDSYGITKEGNGGYNEQNTCKTELAKHNT